MRKLILGMSVSLDGFVAGPDGEADWVFRNPDPTVKSWIRERLGEAGAHIMGRRTFQAMAAHWPNSPDMLAAPMNDIPKVVFSMSGFAVAAAAAGASTSWTQARVATGELAGEILRLKGEPGKDILAHGGAGFARSLVATGLVDEYRLMVQPVALGRGMPLFASLPEPLHLRLAGSVSFASGRVAQTYLAG